jgi:hypothetical protein
LVKSGEFFLHVKRQGPSIPFGAEEGEKVSLALGEKR